MKDGTTIALNLHRIAVERDFQETLLDDEKCMHCGRELMAGYSRKTLCCGTCSRKGLNGRPTTNESAQRKRARAEKHGWDYAFNKGHGERFFRAFDKAYNLKPVRVPTNTFSIFNTSNTSNTSSTSSTLGTAGGSQLRSSRSVPVPARLFLSENRFSLQDIGGQAGRFLRYVTNFQSRVFPPACPPIQEPGMQFCSHTSLLFTTLLQSHMAQSRQYEKRSYALCGLRQHKSLSIAMRNHVGHEFPKADNE